jgi:hypothetical protein
VKQKLRNALIHCAVSAASIALLLLSDQNPRVLLYGLTISLLYCMTTVWFTASFFGNNVLAATLLKVTRLPTHQDRGKPYRNEHSNKPVGVISYILAIATTLFILCIILAIGQGTEFLKPHTLYPELIWGSFIGLLYWIDDISGDQLIIDPEKPVETNLGYNTPALNFLLAAIMISAILMLSVQPILLTLGIQEGHSNWISWALLTTLVSLKLLFQLKADFGPRGSFKALSKHTW